MSFFFYFQVFKLKIKIIKMSIGRAVDYLYTLITNMAASIITILTWKYVFTVNEIIQEI